MLRYQPLVRAVYTPEFQLAPIGRSCPAKRPTEHRCHSVRRKARLDCRAIPKSRWRGKAKMVDDSQHGLNHRSRSFFPTDTALRPDLASCDAGSDSRIGTAYPLRWRALATCFSCRPPPVGNAFFHWTAALLKQPSPARVPSRCRLKPFVGRKVPLDECDVHPPAAAGGGVDPHSARGCGKLRPAGHEIGRAHV